MPESLSTVIKDEVACDQREPPQMKDCSFVGDPPERWGMLLRTGVLRLEAWAAEVQAALCSVGVTRRIARCMTNRVVHGPGEPDYLRLARL